LALVIGLLLVGCGRGEDEEARSGGQTRLSGPPITVWVPVGDEGKQPRAAIDEWNRTQAVKVRAQDVPTGTTSEDVVLSAIAARSTPDVYLGAAPVAVPQYAGGQGLLDLGNEFPDAREFVSGRSGERILEQYSTPEGGLFQVPWRTNPVMVFYNARLFRRAGLDPDSPPRTYSQFLAAMEQLDRAGVTPITQSIDQTWWHRFFDFYPTYLAAGQQTLLSKDGRQVAFNAQAGQQALGFWREVFERKFNPRSAVTLDDNNPFNRGRAGMFVAGPWNIPLIRPGVADDVRATTVPVPDGADTENVTTFGDIKSVVIFSTTKNKRASWEFVKFFLSEGNDRAFLEQANQIPLRSGIGEQVSDRVYTKTPLLRPFAEQVDNVLDIDNNGAGVDVMTQVSLAYQSGAIFQREPVSAALAEAAEKARSELE